MYQEGTSLAQNVKESSPSGSRSVGTVGFDSRSNSVKPIMENIITRSNPASPVVVHANENNTGRINPSNPLVAHLDENYNGELKLASSREINEDLTESEGGGDDAIGDSNDMVGSNSKSVMIFLDKGVQDVVKDAATPPTNGGKSCIGISGDKGKGIVNDSEQHIWTERERRKKMKNMYNTLHSLLPQLPNKADKVSIVGKAIECIKTLECTIQRLENLKMERLRAQRLNAGSSAAATPLMHQGTTTTLSRESTLADMVQNRNAQQAMARSSPGPLLGPIQSWSSPNIALTITGNDGFIIMCMPRQQGVLTKALYILEQCHIDVLTTNILSDANWTMIHIHGRINAASAHFLGNMMTED
ncbi:hypothetical protein EJB05_56458, partial [Eragrostis curvula]